MLLPLVFNRSDTALMTERTIAMRVRDARNNAGLTQQQAAEMAGITQAMWSRIEKGDRKPSLKTLVKIAHALKVSPNDLLPNLL